MKMVSHIQSSYDLRNMTVNKATNIFMKEKNHKVASNDKELEPLVVQIKDPKDK